MAAAALVPSFVLTADPGRQLALGGPWMLYLGAVATAAPYALYSLGLRRVPAAAAGVATLLEPLTATILGVVLFGERLGTAGVVGALLLFSALAILVIPSPTPRPSRASR